MGLLSKVITPLLLANIAFSEESLEKLSNKSLELQTAFKQCGFCLDKRKELESFNENRLIPAIELAGKTIQKKPNKKTIQLIIDIALANKDSADEGFSYALGDAYLADSKIFRQLVQNLKTPNEKKFIFDQTDWGIQNHTKLSKKKMDKILIELKSLSAEIK